MPRIPRATRELQWWDNGFRPREGEVIPKPSRSWDRGLKLALVNMECLVIARHHRAVNTSPLLAHTARRSTRVGFG